MNITDSTILIIGGTSGLGLGLAERFRDRGARVIVTGRRTELLREIEAQHPDEPGRPAITGATLDVADPEAIEATARELIAAHPDLDSVVTMAGIMEIEDLRHPEFLRTAERTVETNLLGTIRSVAAFTRHLQSRPNATIMTVSSGLAFVPLKATPTYSATKAAIHSFTQSLRLQLEGTGVEVLELVPPAVATTLMGQDQDDKGMAMPLDAYLDEVAALLEGSPENGEVLVEGVKFLRFCEAQGTHDGIRAHLAQAY